MKNNNNFCFVLNVLIDINVITENWNIYYEYHYYGSEVYFILSMPTMSSTIVIILFFIHSHIGKYLFNGFIMKQWFVIS